MVRATLLRAAGEKFEVVDLLLPDPGPGQVRVKIVSAGVCHSDLSLANGTLRQDFPVVLGHEGSGVIVSVGEGVESIEVGDHVVLNWSPNCGDCWFCLNDELFLCERAADASKAPYAKLKDGTPVYAGLGTGAFAEETVVSARSVVKIPQELDLRLAALLSCAVLTGVGAVMNTARVKSNETVAVFGLGGVGLSVLQAARAVGVSTLVAIDRTEEKKELAEMHGATSFLITHSRISSDIRQLTGGRGVDHVFDCVGSSESIRAAWSACRRGGSVTVVGIGSSTDLVSFSSLELYWFARTLRGCVFGSSDPTVDIPRMIELVDGGFIDLTSLVTGTTNLSGVGEAFESMAAGRGARVLVDPYLGTGGEQE